MQPRASRRQALLATPLLLPAMAVAQGGVDAVAQGGADAVEAAMGGLRAIGGTSAQVIVDDPASAWRLAHEPDAPLFVGSAIKTFILAAYLLGVEGGTLSLAEQLPVNDGIRSLVSPVVGELTGTMPARSVLEAMIAHSDNTATDIALRRVGIEAVRAVVARAPIQGVRLCTSTRHMFSWLAGAAPGQDLGWAGMQGIMADRLAGPPRRIIGEGETMVAPASALVGWYRHVLAGHVFATPAMLAEFKRISAMADAMAFLVPPDTAAYGKGGSIVWLGENALAVGGQMVFRGRPVSFAFTRNWSGPPEEVGAATGAMVGAAQAILAAVAMRLG